MTARVLIFDSGIGGLTVANALREAMPEVELVYAADNAAFPYGSWDEDKLVKRVVGVFGTLLEATSPDVSVIACNTASTLALSELRDVYDVPFVGTVPAIKPAAASTKSNVIGVLATPGTAQRAYTEALIHTYAFHCKVFVHGASRLAEMAEARLKGAELDMEQLQKEIAPVFRKRGKARTDTVVLGCTHYPLILPELRQAAPWPVEFVDPAPAIARRTMDVLRSCEIAAAHADRGNGKIRADTVLLTADRGRKTDGLSSYQRMGFTYQRLLEIPI